MAAFNLNLLNFFFGVFILLLFSCKSEHQSKFMLEHFKSNYYDPELIINLKIKSRIKYEIPTSFAKSTVIFANGKSISPNKVKTIEYFDSRGLCSLIVIPKYENRKPDTTGFYKLTELEKLFANTDVETNLPNGYYDSTFNFYDKYKRLIKIEYHKTTDVGINYVEFIQTYEYDDNGNVIQLCIDSDNRKSTCRYSIFSYDKAGNILSVVDSFSVDIERLDRPVQKNTRKYSYNKDGLLASLGDEHFVYAKNNLPIEQFRLSGKSKMEIKYFTYDKNGLCVKEENVRSVSSSYDPILKESKVSAYDTSLILRHYNSQKLITEFEFRYSVKQKDYSLYKFEYSYY